MFLFAIQIINAQEIKSENQKSFSLGVTYSNFGNAIVYNNEDLVGTGSISVDHFLGFGIVGIYKAKKWLEFETGAVFTKYHLTTRSAPTPEVYTSKGHSSIFSFPIVARVNFLKYFFVDGGMMIEYDCKLNPDIYDQTGVAATVGIGMKYEFESGLSVFLNPYMTEHAIVSFLGYESRNRIYESAIRFGITYSIK